MKHKIRSIIDGLKNLWKWRKVIYKDRDWDHYYIYEILKTKLKFQAEYMMKHGITEKANEDAEKMLRCVDLIDKAQNEYYLDKAMTSENWTNENFDEAIKKHDECRKEVFNILEKNIEFWWD